MIDRDLGRCSRRQQLLDGRIWEFVCDAFNCDVPFTTADILEAFQQPNNYPPPFVSAYDYSYGRIEGAMLRVAKVFTLDPPPEGAHLVVKERKNEFPYDIVWCLPSNGDDND